jgi:transaldolase
MPILCLFPFCCCIQLIKWDQMSLANAMGPAAVQLLTSGLDGYADQAKRVEDLFGKIWPPPNV